jgi:hypothetical protein
MSDSTFIMAMAVVALCVVGVIAGLIFLVVKSTKRKKKKIDTKKSEPMVYISPNGKKYHFDPMCFTHDDENCIEIELETAIKTGYTPCSKCAK